jgi:hypothetical protein
MVEHCLETALKSHNNYKLSSNCSAKVSTLQLIFKLINSVDLFKKRINSQRIQI